jgi:putative Mg2+ transporter-C (MgtC) family protein
MLGNVEIVGRLLLAAVLGSAIGFERERLAWAAGMRTHMLVAVGACLIMIVSAYGFAEVLGRPNIMLDPSRIAAQVVSGIGFLGAGTILLRGEVVKGLTTAASLWGVAAIGLACGAGLYVAAIATTVIVLVILAGVKPFEERYRARIGPQSLKVTAHRDALSLPILRDLAGPHAPRIRQFVARQGFENGLDEIVVTFAQLSQRKIEEIAGRLREQNGILSVDSCDAP